MSKPRILDLFCGAGGAAKGYALAGFEVVGVDIKPQPRYPFEFHQLDATAMVQDVLNGCWHESAASALPGRSGVCLGRFEAIHGSPPCQAFTSLRHMYNAKPHADLLTPTRAQFIACGLPYVIENVEGAPMSGAHITLCGTAFGLGTDGAELRRHRHFDANFPIMVSPCQHGRKPRVIGVYGGHGRDRRRKVGGQDFPTSARREAMGIDWMTGTELSQAIPPAYTAHIGSYLMAEVERRAKGVA